MDFTILRATYNSCDVFECFRKSSEATRTLPSIVGWKERFQRNSWCFRSASRDRPFCAFTKTTPLTLLDRPNLLWQRAKDIIPAAYLSVFVSLQRRCDLPKVRTSSQGVWFDLGVLKVPYLTKDLEQRSFGDLWRLLLEPEGAWAS